MSSVGDAADPNHPEDRDIPGPRRGTEKTGGSLKPKLNAGNPEEIRKHLRDTRESPPPANIPGTESYLRAIDLAPIQGGPDGLYPAQSIMYEANVEVIDGKSTTTIRKTSEFGRVKA